eukprot:GSMAST32.ASY1.ANO1.1864.1 assembled CDS
MKKYFLTINEKWIWDCAFSADSSYLVTASSDFSARLWEVRRGVVVRHYTVCFHHYFFYRFRIFVF